MVQRVDFLLTSVLTNWPPRSCSINLKHTTHAPNEFCRLYKLTCRHESSGHSECPSRDQRAKQACLHDHHAARPKRYWRKHPLPRSRVWHPQLFIAPKQYTSSIQEVYKQYIVDRARRVNVEQWQSGGTWYGYTLDTHQSCIVALQSPSKTNEEE